MDDWCYDIHAAVVAAEPQARAGDEALATVLRWIRWLEDVGVVQVVGVVGKRRKETCVERTDQARDAPKTDG